MSRANFEPLHSAAHPQRQPYVRSLSYVDTKGPAPFEFFDQFQDHLGAFADTVTARDWTIDGDDFTDGRFRSGYFGRMAIQHRVQVNVAASASADVAGAHGIGSALGTAMAWNFAAAGAGMGLGADFLLTCKIKIVNPGTLDPAADGGLLVAVGSRATSPSCPGFAAGGDTETWRIYSAADDTHPGILYDTGIACLPGVWYRLQISRVRGAVRWFVNGRLALRDGLEGHYYPYPLVGLGVLPGAQKWIEMSRFLPGAANEGIYVDCCHLLAQRSLP